MSRDEFAFLRTDAERVGVSSLPAVERFTHTHADGSVSGLKFGTDPERFTFLHGAGLNAHTFDPTILALEHPARSIDLPGHGRSAWRQDADYRPQTMAPAVADVIQHHAVDAQILVGHSLGGLTAIRVAAERPDLIQELVIVDITPGVGSSDATATVREFIAGQSSYASIDEIIDRAIAFNIGHDRDALRRGITLNTRLRDDGRLEWTHHLAHLLADNSQPKTVLSPESRRHYAELWADLDAIVAAGIPVTLIRGETGMVSPALAEEWQLRLPHASVQTIEAGHNVQEHAPTELAKVLKRLADTVTIREFE